MTEYHCTDEVLKVLSTLDDEQTDIVIKFFRAHIGAEDMSTIEKQETYGRFTTMLYKELNPHQRKAVAHLRKDIWTQLEEFEGNLYEKAIQTMLQTKKKKEEDDDR